MNAIIFAVTFIIIGFAFQKALQNTPFEISAKNSKMGGVLLAREIFLLILLGAFLISNYGISNFRTFSLTEESISSTTPYIIYSVIALITTIGLLSKTIFKRWLTWEKYPSTTTAQELGRRSAFLDSFATLALILIFTNHIFGVKNAFITTLLEGADLLTIRLSNKYDNESTTIFMGLLKFSYVSLIATLGIHWGNTSKSKKFIYLCIVIYAASMSGEKAPLVSCLILFYLGRTSGGSIKFSHLITLTPIAALSIILLVFYITSIQFPNLDGEEIILYIFERVAIGQILGVYEQFSIKLSDINYIMTEIPLSGLLFNQVSFAKDLMMQTGAVGMSSQEIGVMNSFFIGEALAIGGHFLVVLSPLIVALNYCLIFYIIARLISNTYNFDKNFTLLFLSLFYPSVVNFTGDFGGLLFMKKLPPLILFFLIAHSIFQLIRGFKTLATHIRR